MGNRTRASALVGVALGTCGFAFVRPAWAQLDDESGQGTEEEVLSEAEAEEHLRRKVGQDPWVLLEEGTLEVEVDDGVAVVRGRAKNLLAKDRVTYLADQIPGVDEVVNQVVIGGAPASDVELDRRVAETVEALGVEGDAIFTEVRDGAVRIYGDVTGPDERVRVEEALEALPGVRTVESWLRVDPIARPSGEALQVQIQRRLLLSPVVDAGRVGVAVRGREVLLTGVVGSLEARTEAIRAAWTEGAEDVFAQTLQVQPEPALGATGVGAEVLAEQVALELAATPWTQGADIEVVVDGSDVTLRGEVPTRLARQELARHALDLPGVDEVVAELSVVPPYPLPGEDLEEAVVERLRRDPLVAGQVRVSAANGVVRLAGEVPTRYERERIEALVGGVVGVVGIDDDLRVRGAEEESEARLERYFSQRLARAADLEGASVRVILTPQGVLLEGVAETERARAAAERIAKDISARPVANRIRVG